MLERIIQTQISPAISKNQKGFTLLELVVALSIMGIVAGVVIGVVAINARTANLVSSRTLARYDIRDAFQALRDDIQQISPGNIIYDGGNLNSHRLEFNDMDGNNILYLYSSGSVTRNGTAILSNVQQNPFSYLDQNLNITNVRENVLYIDVDLQVTYGNETVTLGDRFYVRN